MTKQLRLAVGELTDVGRRRERNQDNVIHFVPTDPQLFSRRGALFVVCDGMGGHAAGEIASDIGVRTIRDEYFQRADEDVVDALSHAIRAANAAIFQHAREHLSHTGMGTTCVAVALVGGRGYFVNIGDSRGYIVRHGVMRQVTRDHSWVAEQVRAGVLTEEQARTHSHRNVITRSLGTQPDVSADLFIEDIQDGDHILLCSDGLHGYVAADEIQRVILEQDPESGVRQLVDLANANGGPDNITAVVVRLLEVPAEADTVPLPAVAMARKTRNLAEEATVPLRLDRPVGAPTAAAPLDERVAAVAAPVAVAGERAKRAVWPVVGLRLLAVAALCLLAFGAWDLLAGPYADGRTANAQALRDVATAQSVAAAALSQNPDSALANLAAQQQQLRHDLATLALDTTGRAKVQQALDGTIASAVQKVLDGYNTKFRIAALPASAVTPYRVSCGGETVASGPLAAVGAVPTGGSEASPPTLYAVTRSGALYAMSYGSGVATCGATPLVPAGVQEITSDATQLYALVQQGTAWAVLAVDASAPPSVKIALPADTPGIPVALAAQGGDFYVVYQQASSLGSAILHFGGGDLKKPTQTIATPATVTALVASTASSPFALLRDGTVVTWDAGGHVSVVAIALAQPVISDDPSTYRGATPVPTFPPTATPAPVTPTPTPAPVSGSIVPATTATPTTAPATTTTPGAPTSTPSTATATATSGAPTPVPTATPMGAVTVFGGSSSLATDRAGGLFIGDGTTPRVVRFTVSGTDLLLVHQYVYATSRAPLRTITSSPDGTHLFAWSGDQLVEVTLPA